MAANIQPIFVKTAHVTGQTFVNADGTSKKTLFTATADGSLVSDINITSDDTSARDLDLFINDGATDFPIGTIPVAIGAGVTAGSNAANGMDSIKIPGVATDGTFFLPSGYLLKGAMKVAVTAAKTIAVVVFAGDY